MTRPPAVAGLFYEGNPQALSRTVAGLLAASRPAAGALAASSWRALLLPHAGYAYSGAVAAAGFGAVLWPRTVLLLGPNHTGRGRPVALSPDEAWETPLGPVAASRRLAALLVREAPEVEPDSRAHEAEHSIEVMLPFLQAVRPDAQVACLCVAEPRLSVLRSLGRAVARAVAGFEEETGERVAVVVSSDMSHFLPREENGERDRRALEALLSGDPEELYGRVVVREKISMCGVLPATVLLEALRHLSPVDGTLLRHSDSADAGGDSRRVVGYAAVLWTERTPS